MPFQTTNQINNVLCYLIPNIFVICFFHDEPVLERIGEMRKLLNNILRRKAKWISHILRRNWLPHDVIEGQMTEVKGEGKRRTQVFDDLKIVLGANIIEEVDDQNRWK